MHYIIQFQILINKITLIIMNFIIHNECQQLYNYRQAVIYNINTVEYKTSHYYLSAFKLM